MMSFPVQKCFVLLPCQEKYAQFKIFAAFACIIGYYNLHIPSGPCTLMYMPRRNDKTVCVNCSSEGLRSAYMRKRQQRHDVIRDIIRAYNVKTQRDLADQLQAEGYDCTQATISRDIMDMGLVKSREGFYVLPEEMRLQRMVSELVEEVHLAGNMVVVKTYSGGAAGVSAALDKANLKGALGTVAGDNTIMIATITPEAAQDVAGAINRLRRR